MAMHGTNAHSWQHNVASWQHASNASTMQLAACQRTKTMQLCTTMAQNAPE